jgi:hypothetical protein
VAGYLVPSAVVAEVLVPSVVVTEVIGSSVAVAGGLVRGDVVPSVHRVVAYG